MLENITLLHSNSALSVFKATNSRLNRTVAVYLFTQMEDERSILEFLEECRILSAIQHANIAQIFTGGRNANGCPYVITEYVDGRAFIELVQPGPLSIKEARVMFDQALQAVSVLHEQGLVHGGLSASSFVLTLTGQVKLIEFGNRFQFTSTVRENCTEPASDIFALGCIFCLLLTGQDPSRFETRVDPNQLLSSVVALIPPIGSDSISYAKLESFLACSLANSPEKRYESIKLMQKDFSELALAPPLMEPAPLAPTGSSNSAPPERSKEPALVAGESIKLPKDSKPGSRSRFLFFGAVIVCVMACAGLLVVAGNFNCDVKIAFLRKESAQLVERSKHAAGAELYQIHQQQYGAEFELGRLLSDKASTAKGPEGKDLCDQALKCFSAAIGSSDSANEVGAVLNAIERLQQLSAKNDFPPMIAQINDELYKAAVAAAADGRLNAAYSIFNFFRDNQSKAQWLPLVDRLIPVARQLDAHKLHDLVSAKMAELKKTNGQTDELAFFLIESLSADAAQRMQAVKEAQQIISTHPRKDFSRACLLVKLVNAVPELDGSQALSYLLQARSLMEACGRQDSRDYAQSIFDEGRVRYRLKQTEESIACYQKSSRLFRDRKDLVESAVAAREACFVLSMQKSPADRVRLEDSLEKELAFLFECSDFPNRDWFVYDFAQSLITAYCKDHDAVKAVKVANTSADFLNKRSYCQSGAALQVQAAQETLAQGDIPQTAQLSNAALSLMRRITPQNVGSVAPPMAANDPAAADKRRGIVFLQRAQVSHNLGLLLFHCGDATNGSLVMVEAIRLFNELAQTGQASATTSLLISWLEKSGDQDKVIQLEKDLLTKCTNVDITLNLCERLKRAGKTSELVNYLTAVENALKTQVPDASFALWYLQLGCLLQSSSLDGKEQRAKECFQKSVEFASKFGQVAVEASARKKLQ